MSTGKKVSLTSLSSKVNFSTSKMKVSFHLKIIFLDVEVAFIWTRNERMSICSQAISPSTWFSSFSAISTFGFLVLLQYTLLLTNLSKYLSKCKHKREWGGDWKQRRMRTNERTNEKKKRKKVFRSFLSRWSWRGRTRWNSLQGNPLRMSMGPKERKKFKEKRKLTRPQKGYLNNHQITFLHYI